MSGFFRSYFFAASIRLERTISQALTLPKTHPALLLNASYFLLIFSAHWPIIFSRGSVGLVSDWTVPPLNWQQLQVGLETFYTWNHAVQGVELVRQVGVYLDRSLSFFAFITNIDGTVLTKYPFILLPFTAVMMYRLARRLNFSLSASYLAGLFYLATPLFFDSIAEGYLFFLISFIFIPELIGDFFLLPQHHSIRQIIKSGLIFGLIAAGPNYLVITGLFCLCILIGHLCNRSLTLRTKGHLVLATVGVMIGPVIFEPTILSLVFQFIARNIMSLINPTVQDTFAQKLLSNATNVHLVLDPPKLYAAIALLGSRFTNNYYNSLRGTSYEELWVLSRIPWLLVIWCIPWLAKRRRGLLLTIVSFALIGIFLGKGTSPPLGHLTKWLYLNVPLSSVVRNSYYISVITALCYSLMLAIAIEWWERKKIQRWIVPSLFLLGLISLLPHFQPYLKERLRPYQLPADSRQYFNQLRRDWIDQRYYSLPSQAPVFLENNGYGKNSGRGINPFVQIPSRPTFWPNIDPPNATFLSAHLANLITFNRTTHFGFSAALGNIDRIVLDRNFISAWAGFIVVSDNPWLRGAFDNLITERHLDRQQDIRVDTQFGLIKSYVNRIPTAHVRAETGVTLLVGTFETVSALAEIGRYAYPPSLLIASQLHSLTPEVINQIERLVITEGEEMTLATTFLPQHYKYDLGDLLTLNDANAAKHWVDPYINQWWWKEPPANTIGNYVFTQAPSDFPFSVTPFSKGPQRLLLQYYRSPDSKQLKLSINDQPIQTIDAYWADGRGYTWYDAGEIDSAGQPLHLVLTSSEGTHAAARIIVVPSNEWIEAQKQAAKLLASKPIIYRASPRESVVSQLHLPKSTFYTVFADQGAKSSSNQLNYTEQSDLYQPVKELGKIAASTESALTITDETPLSPNLIKGNQFSDNLDDWQVSPDTGEPEKTDCTVCAFRQRDTEKNWYLALRHDGSLPNNNSEEARVEQGIEHLPAGQYQIDFDYLTLQKLGRQPGIRITQDNGRIIVSAQLGNHQDWRHYRANFSLDGKTKTSIIFFTDSIKEQLSEVGIKNVSLRRVKQPHQSIFVEEETFSELTPTILAEHSRRHNPAVYSLSVPAISHPWVLSFLETYHEHWQPEINGQPVKATHLRLNGYGQGWIMPPITEPTTIKLIFSSQRTYALANVASLVLLLTVCLLWVWAKPKQLKSPS